MADTEYLTKMQALTIIGMATGYGRSVIERTMNELKDAGRIAMEQAPDRRTIHISRQDVDLVIAVLKKQA